VDAAAEIDPALAPHHGCADQLYGHQRQKSEAIRPGCEIHQPVVVDPRDEKHQSDADQQKGNLLVVEVVEPGGQRRRSDLQHAERGDQQHQAEEHPVEVAG